MKVRLLAALIAQCLFFGAASAQDAPFTNGWTLDEADSSLHFLSVRQGEVIELSSFASLGGTIDEEGNATFEIALDSVDTKLDLLNVRLRFMFFETYEHPKATVTASIAPALVGELQEHGFTRIELPITLNMHGIKQDMLVHALVSLVGPDQVSIVTTKPVLIKFEDFNLSGGHKKLTETADFTVVPATSVTFSVTFNRNAVAPEDYLTSDVCKGRLETLSRSGNIHFETASAELHAASSAPLNDIAFVVKRCPNTKIQIAGFTDSWGKSKYNRWLSEERSKSVVNYLVDLGLPRDRFVSRGFGEANPVATNETAAGRNKNRRIEFSIIGNFSG